MKACEKDLPGFDCNAPSGDPERPNCSAASIASWFASQALARNIALSDRFSFGLTPPNWRGRRKALPPRVGWLFQGGAIETSTAMHMYHRCAVFIASDGSLLPNVWAYKHFNVGALIQMADMLGLERLP